MDLDQFILHVQKVDGTDEAQVTRELSERCSTHLEINPNRIVFHTAEEIRRLQGVGVLLKEQKIVDHRPAAKSAATQTLRTGTDAPAPSPAAEGIK